MKTKPLFIMTAGIETGAGIVLLVSPALAASLLIGAPFDSPADSVFGRVAGAALLALALACWRARFDTHDRSARGLVSAMLFYNVIVALVLAYAGIGWRLFGVLLWPAVVLHTVMTIWCLAVALIERR
jgi:hypothetical protein